MGKTTCKNLGKVGDLDDLLFQMYSNLDSHCLFEMPVGELERIWGIPVYDYTPPTDTASEEVNRRNIKKRDEYALKRQAERLGIADKVTFLGGVRNLTEYFKEVDILLNNPRCPGDSCAGVGNNVLEAGLYDTPVVTYNMGGIKEMVIQGETGYCFPLGAAEEFADAVEMLVKDKSLRDRIGKALHRRVAHLCSDEEIYRTTMNAYNMEAV